MEMTMTVGAIDCDLTNNFDRFLGIILCLLGVIPVMVWAGRFAVELATDPRVLMFGVPFVCAGLYFIERSRCRAEY